MERRLMLSVLGGAALGATERLQAAVVRKQQAHPYFPDSVLQDHSGKSVRFYTDLLKGKVVVINMMYTVCTRICPTNIARLREVQAQLGKRSGQDVHLYSLTLRPDIDSPEALAAYARQFDTAPGWSFLTGDPQEMDVIRRRLGFYDADPVADADIANHTGALRLGNVDRDRWLMMPNRTVATQVVKAIDNLM
ncbi:SCO family protein [Massilia sp. ML15P13]|uniref:SCO family protein n=2 Tax=Telluria aromaticivorans TaxID=2725995 RepID=A0A7Y2K3D4_9BURK|nr:SCO family protein [Telluria aromaticivorans]